MVPLASSFYRFKAVKCDNTTTPYKKTRNNNPTREICEAWGMGQLTICTKWFMFPFYRLPPGALTPLSPRCHASQRRPRSLGNDPIAQSIKHNIQQGRSELRLAGEDAGGRLSCAVHLRRAFRKRRKNLGAIRANGDGAELFVVGRCPRVSSIVMRFVGNVS